MVQVHSLPKWESGIFRVGSSIFVEKTTPTQRTVGAESGFYIFLALHYLFSMKHSLPVCFGKINFFSPVFLQIQPLSSLLSGEFNIPSGFSSGNLSLQPYEAY